jgi:hypothetical protein
VNQADEVESIGHGRELTADSVPGKKESAIEHGDENAIEAPRNYNEFSVNGNKPLNSVSQSRGALQVAVPLPHCSLALINAVAAFSRGDLSLTCAGILPSF